MKLDNPMGDVMSGRQKSPEELLIGALVMMPFTSTLVVLLGWMVPLPNIVAILLFIVLTVPAALWNAARRLHD
ncbi:MAG TPA: hypothetical protein VM430_16915 [Microbacterium sp.]|jgi:hypothetical protein|nr:hypothetical protein [Microbacterium sp.]